MRSKILILPARSDCFQKKSSKKFSKAFLEKKFKRRLEILRILVSLPRPRNSGKQAAELPRIPCLRIQRGWERNAPQLPSVAARGNREGKPPFPPSLEAGGNIVGGLSRIPSLKRAPLGARAWKHGATRAGYFLREKDVRKTQKIGVFFEKKFRPFLKK